MSTYLNAVNADLLKVAKEHSNEYQTAAPFPNIYFENFFDPSFLEEVLEEFPDLSKKDSIQYNNEKEIKLAGKGERFFGPKTKNFMNFLNSEYFLLFLQELTGIKEILISDPYYVGGGQHEIKRGGLLKVHADFNKHPHLLLDRRINVLIYLNKDWKEEYGGYFELWDKDMQSCVKRVLPKFNTMAIFSTTDFSYHGHPDPLQCPEGRSRKSLALYYYSNGRPLSEIDNGKSRHHTLFKERKNNQVDKLAFSKNDAKRITLHSIIREVTPPFVLKVAKKILQ